MEAANVTSNGHFYDFVNDDRASTQIMVQILSHSLGLAHVHILTTCLNNATRLIFERRSVCSLGWCNHTCCDDDNAETYGRYPGRKGWNRSWAPFPANVTYNHQGAFSYSPRVSNS